MSEVSVRNVSMSYGRVRALDGVSLEVRALDGVSLEVEGGTVSGIIGPDGAGKTTLFRIMTTMLLPDAGEVRVCGCDVRKDFMEIRRMIGYMPGHFSLYQDLTVEENLSLFAAVFNTTIQENYHLVAEIYSQLEPFRKRRAGRLSGGMKQKLALCCAMIHKPRVLFLDEPTTGVDPVSRKEFWQMLARLKAQGITIVVSTPYMDEASKCDVISLMKDGRFFRTDTPEAIVKGFGKRMYELDVQGSIVRALDDVASVQGVQSCSPFGDRIHIVSPSLGREELSGRLSAIGYDTSSLREAEPTVEDCFIEFDSRQNE